MDGSNRYGAVMSIENIKNPISVARSVMDNCVHNILCGEGATRWAVGQGFQLEPDVLTDESKLEWEAWKEGLQAPPGACEHHDTIGLICILIVGVVGLALQICVAAGAADSTPDQDYSG